MINEYGVDHNMKLQSCVEAAKKTSNKYWGGQLNGSSKLKEKIKAPHYIFVNGTNDSTGGLFGNKNRKVLFL